MQHVLAKEKRELCPDCAVTISSRHQEGCDIERCSECGMQRLMCTAFNDHPHDPDASLWTGYWPGVVECHWMKWFTPDGQHDLNRLALLHARGHE